MSPHFLRACERYVARSRRGDSTSDMPWPVQSRKRRPALPDLTGAMMRGEGGSSITAFRAAAIQENFSSSYGTFADLARMWSRERGSRTEKWHQSGAAMGQDSLLGQGAAITASRPINESRARRMR